MKPIDLFMQFFRREGWIYAIGLTMLMAIDVAFLFVPQFIGNAIDTLSNNKEGLVTYIYYFILLFIIITILKVISRRTLLGSIRRMEYLFREILCSKALQVKTTYYEANGPGKVMALMTNDVTSLRVALGLGVMIVVDIIFYSVVGSIILIQKINTVLAFKIMTPVFLIIVAIFVLGRKLRTKQRSAQATYSDLTEFGQELFQGMDVIRAFNRESIISNSFEKINKLYLTNGTLNETKTSTINYTLDAQKRPLTTKTEYKRYSPANVLTFETKMLSIYQYANYNNIVKNIVGFDKLVYSDFILDDELPFDIISYLKEEVTNTNYSSGVPTPAPGGFVNELKYEHTVNSNNYPIKKENLEKNSTTGQFQKNGYYQTIEYNK